ncbi:symmetrical bis(5'-nucleosyl)-tetraphosphatase [Neisseria zalophi]|uniref:bis(5'-nucleosyl)-tetraphosphatase (symmetrical) n=1 Tax=Neisseria zalophi TaxID=640030 RepID=A0A5J6Q0N6_9NEIS|nr:symmetrical bis(5'-nucleosyl)-tetraphosphatase [Neisseria zalophi]QEY26567.1 symmetrical bis(5'-nucleosyl)-tetraphosphatase [Neisseria zalophi]
MAHYAIGDVQGCFQELTALLNKIDFNHGKDTLWLTGDIVNRGPQSLETLQFVMQHESSIRTILGNHDLHLLAVSYGYGEIKRGDTILPILEHPKSKKMLDWLQSQPLLIHGENHVLVHAGLLPQWDISQAESLAREVETVLQGNDKKAKNYFSHMYGNKPRTWKSDLSGYDRLRMITNVFTRMRAITIDKNKLDYDFKAGLDKMPKDLCAWFEAPNRQHLSHTIVFGHWSALGYLNQYQVISLDTGALWGGKLTAINLETNEITQVPSQSGLHWKTAL